ncbi:unnamed protein product [marine sediment metagenome]|uniref:Methyltransferase type 11 domain-containing protein n=1 Tax=marine sediment metagenome TaxID=412755 RepID=X0SD37_9ZZZZ
MLQAGPLREQLYYVLNVAPDPGFNGVWERLQGCIIELDIRPWKGVRVVMDLHHLGFKDGCFDLVVCSHVLEHVRDDVQCMEEIWLYPGFPTIE